MTKYKPGTRVKKSNTTKIVIIAGVVIVAAIAGGIGVMATGGLPNPAQFDNSDAIVMHIHPKLSLIVDGKPLSIPTNIGIDPNLYKDHTFDAYGMKMPNMSSMPVMYPTHTHDTSGTIHVESTVKRDYTLGDFLNVWGMDFSGKTVKMTIDGKPATESDYRNHIFKDGEQITLEVS